MIIIRRPTVLRSLVAIEMIYYFCSMDQGSEKNKTPSVVAVLHCPSYDFTHVEKAVKHGIELVGGITAFAKANERLVFKPNVLAASDPDRCVVTHPAVLRAAICAFSATGASLSYGDSPSALSPAEPSMERCGYNNALAGFSVTRAPFELSSMVHFPDARIGKRFTIVQSVLDADGIINLPKLKTHALTRMTGAIKNCFGCVPMAAKVEFHARFPDPYHFSQLLADIATFLRPRLHIMDAIMAMEGNGPQSGTPKKLGAILVSTDPVALDVVACRLIGLDPAHVPTIAAAVRCGLGYADAGMIRLVGDAVEPLIDSSFDVVRMPPVAPSQTAASGAIKLFFLPRPSIDHKRCTHCRLCVSVCPPKPSALSQKSEKRPPIFDYGICIRCYCCQEMCPSGAISIKNPPLSCLLPFARYAARLLARLRAGREE
jgi:uncharacterized protein (DUF362 family)/Pyruvate/2-oxoacid:ferredoxin oxidoreductase delta subunit